MPPKLPTFEPGSKLSKIPAREWQAMADAVARNVNFVAGPGITLTDIPGGKRIGLSQRPPDTRPEERTVVVTVEPQTDDKTITVRQVKYADIPPEEHKYAFDGEDFTAYPDLGYAVKDYKTHYHDPEEAMGERTRFLRAEKRRGVWLLRQYGGAGGVDGVVVRHIEDEGGFFLDVERVILNEEGQWVCSGDDWEELFTWPKIPAKAYELLVLPVGDPGWGDVVQTAMIDGVECVRLDKFTGHTIIRSDDPHRGARPHEV